MVSKTLLTFFAVLCMSEGIFGINIIGRSQWGGRPATPKSLVANNLPYVVIHHSAAAYCSTMDACKAQMRNIQNYHMDIRGYDDIGYNFAIGGDGNIYEGRGFGVMGAHTGNWDSKSIGIVFIGNYNYDHPTAAQVSSAQELLDHAISTGNLAYAYFLYGHNQVESAQCPGNNLYAEIKKWSNWMGSIIEVDAPPPRQP